jgi:glutamate transport system permease protein
MSQAVLYDVQGPKARRRVLLVSLLGGALLLLLLALAARRLAANGQFEYEKYEPFFTEPVLYERLLLTGLKNTLIAAAYALVLALVLGSCWPSVGCRTAGSSGCRPPRSSRCSVDCRCCC